MCTNLPAEVLLKAPSTNVRITPGFLWTTLFPVRGQDYAQARTRLRKRHSQALHQSTWHAWQMSKKYERGPDKQLTKDGLRDARLDALAIVEAEFDKRPQDRADLLAGADIEDATALILALTVLSSTILQLGGFDAPERLAVIRRATLEEAE
jgi:hypothetical protein